MQHNTLPIRPRRLRRLLALTAFGAILSGTGLGWATDARADAGTDYAALNAGRICATLDQFPSITGVAGIGKAIVDEGYLSYYEAGRAIGVSVAVVCPWHQPVLDRFIAANAAAQPVVKR